MVKILPFRRRRRWTKSRDYGAPPPRTKFWPDEEKVTLGGVARETVEWLWKGKSLILAGILLSIWPMADPALIEPPAFLSTDPEQVNEQFTRCGIGRGHACVIDGDTFKLGERKVRLVGIDAPETHPPRCAEEARLGEAATGELQRLLNQGPFEMVGRSFNDQDRYGRDLRVVKRVRPNGSEQNIADAMRESGLARRYLGGLKGGWC